MNTFHDAVIAIESFTTNGFGLGTHEGLKVFVLGAIPGDHVTVKIKKKKRRYVIAAIKTFIHTSPLRISSPCSHFPVCGGCQIIDIPYDKQIELKQTLFDTNITHFLPTKPQIRNIIPSPSNTYYRNKMEFAFGLSENNKIILGLKKRGCYDIVVETPNCKLQDQQTQSILEKTQSFFESSSLSVWNYITKVGCLSHLMIRHSKSQNTFMLQLNVTETHPIIYRNFAKFISESAPNITSIYVKINHDTPILQHGTNVIHETIGTLTFSISPQSFFQPNSLHINALYNEVKRAAQLNGTEIVYDLYCGTGTIGLFLASNARHVVGIEEVPEAILNATQNAMDNQITNTSFYQGRVKNILKEILQGKRPNINKPDCIIIDPPRSGIVPKALSRIIQLNAATIVYVSCNPDTLVKDLQQLTLANYTIEYIQPVDMFPNTFHIEAVVRLKRISPHIGSPPGGSFIRKNNTPELV
jgi:23S rRNA (uracil1939-C5)-methyltransferase